MYTNVCISNPLYKCFVLGISVYEDIANGTASYSKYKLYSNGTWTSESTSEASKEEDTELNRIKLGSFSLYRSLYNHQHFNYIIY